MNQSFLSGRLTADPELRATHSGVECCNFTLAVKRPKSAGKPQVTDFFRCTAWRQTAAFIAKYFKKGDGIIVQGSMETSKYTDKSGQERETYSVQVQHVDFGEKSTKSQATAQGFQPVDDPELPF